MSGTETQRQQKIADLRTLVDFLEAHPDVPIGNAGPSEFCVSAKDDETGMAQLQAIADALGVELTHNGDATQHFATRRFGTAFYKAFYCTRESMAEYAENQEWVRARRQSVTS